MPRAATVRWNRRAWVIVPGMGTAASAVDPLEIHMCGLVIYRDEPGGQIMRMSEEGKDPVVLGQVIKTTKIFAGFEEGTEGVIVAFREPATSGLQLHDGIEVKFPNWPDPLPLKFKHFHV